MDDILQRMLEAERGAAQKVRDAGCEAELLLAGARKTANETLTAARREIRAQADVLVAGRIGAAEAQKAAELTRQDALQGGRQAVFMAKVASAEEEVARRLRGEARNA